jgi:acetyl-CoA acetyltransferase
VVGGHAVGRTPAHSYPSSDWPDHATTFAHHLVDRALWTAGVGRDDVDFLELYDPFTIFVLTQLEDLGYCAKGEAGAFVAEGHIGHGGRLPVNLNGGLLSEGHVQGLNNLVEAVRQLRGDAGPRQVADAEVGLVTAGEAERGGLLVLHR